MTVAGSATDLLSAGDPQGALVALQQQVRAEPATAHHRVFLFQLLAYLGDWERALTQLNVAADLDDGTLGMVQVYRTCLASEGLRAEIFAGRRAPLVFGDPDRWIALMIEALRVEGEGQHAEGAKLRGEALELAPATSGTLNGEPFEWLADGDSRFGPMTEVIMNGNYYWVPFDRIKRVDVEAPEDLRDLVWLPAEFHWVNGGDAYGLIPVRYPGTERADDIKLRTGGRTEWDEVSPDTFHGFGQRELTTDSADYPVLEVRQLAFDADDAQSDA